MRYKLITPCLLLLVSMIIIIVTPGVSFASDEPYDDVKPDNWFYAEVTALAKDGIFGGTDCKEGFCPGQPLERWQMAVWMIRVLEKDQDLADLEISRFDDVENGNWWIKYVEKLAELKITVGCKSEPLRYCPERAVSRAQMAAFLARAFDLPEANRSAGFGDVTDEHWATSSINALAASKITVGCKSEPSLYCPSQEVTKAQAAVFLARALAWQEEQTAKEEAEQSGGEGGSFGGGGSSSGGSSSGSGSGGGSSSGGGGSTTTTIITEIKEEEPPGSPLFLNLDFSGSHIIASWREPDSGGAVDNYLLNWRVQGGTWSDDELLAASSRATVIVNPQSGTAYEVQITAVNAAGTAYSIATITVPSSPGQPRNVYAAREDSGGLWIRWQPPKDDGGMSLTKYIVQWKTAEQEFGGIQQAEVTDLQKLWYTVADAGEADIYSARVIAANQIGLGDPSESVQERMLDRSLLLLEDSEVQNLHLSQMKELGQLLADQYWRYIENEVVSAHEAKHPWLREAWSHTKQELSALTVCMPKICSSSNLASLVFDCRQDYDPGSGVSSCRVKYFFVKYGLTDLDFIIIHELAHVLTLSNQVSSHPGQLALASLYFVEASKYGSNCDQSELYADVLEATILGLQQSTYWSECSTTPSTPPPEALEVIESALRGQTSTWFISKYSTSSNDWDYAAIWQDINRIDSIKDRIAAAYNLRDQFGGYCNPQKANQEIYTGGNADTVGNPWRDGGCI